MVLTARACSWCESLIVLLLSVAWEALCPLKSKVPGPRFSRPQFVLPPQVECGSTVVVLTASGGTSASSLVPETVVMRERLHSLKKEDLSIPFLWWVNLKKKKGKEIEK